MPLLGSSSHLLKRRSAWIIAASSALLLLVGGALYSRLTAQEMREERELAPGLTLLSVQTNLPGGPLKYWLVKADPARWDLGLEVANTTDVQKKRSVRNLAAQSNATVAINGGFFAYGGAAVGAVKVDGQWHRLPWKSRTALGWNDNGARIDPLNGSCQLSLQGNDGSIRVQEAALNGFNLPGMRTAIVDGYAVLTSQFAPFYKLRAGEVAAIVQNGQIMSRTVGSTTPVELPLPTEGFLLIARGNVAPELMATQAQPMAKAPAPTALRGASWKTVTSPGWDDFGQILGAGPRLVRDGLPFTTEKDEEFLPDVVARGPRTCVGWDQHHNWLFFVADGRRTNESVGLTLPEVGALFQQLGAVQAMNLDGGSSTQLVINGELVNHPSGFDPVNPIRAREVQVSNALVLKPRG